MKALSTRNDDPQRASRPFDKDRDGFVMAEGAGILIFEELRACPAPGSADLRRGDGLRLPAPTARTSPSPNENGDGAAIAMRDCLDDAGVDPDSSTTSTPTARARRWATWPRPWRSRRCSATTPQGGHQQHQVGHGPPAGRQRRCRTGRDGAGDPQRHRAADHQPGQSRSAVRPGLRPQHRPPDARVAHAMSNSFGFGGHNACILVSRLE